jgi:hypothetical protein
MHCRRGAVPEAAAGFAGEHARQHLFGNLEQLEDEGLMDTHLMIGLAVMMGLIGIAASRDLLRRLRAQQPQLIPIKIERPSDDVAVRRGR